jgi:putative flippase GtrA
MMRLWMRFNVVGLGGILVQLLALKLLREGLGMNYLWATALAVEIAVIHNFLWHWRWTWRERGVDGSRFLHFQCTTGFVSIAGNLFGMSLLSGVFHLPLLAANLLSIAMTYAFNFLAADRYVFRLR